MALLLFLCGCEKYIPAYKHCIFQIKEIEKNIRKAEKENGANIDEELATLMKKRMRLLENNLQEVRKAHQVLVYRSSMFGFLFSTYQLVLLCLFSIFQVDGLSDGLSVGWCM